AVTGPAQIDALRAALGVTPGEEWAGFAPDTPEARHIGALPPLFLPPPSPPAPAIPDALDEPYPEQASTQEAFGRVLAALGRLPVGDDIVTLSADVAVTTHLAGWMNRKGVYFPEARPDPFADVPQTMKWREGPGGQHIELGIAEHDLFLLLAALGLTAELSGRTLLPIGTLYDPFVTRGLDALYHALYAGARFVVVATPSGVSLAPEGWEPERAVNVFATGVMVTEALAAARRLAERAAFPSVFVVTSPDRLYRGLREPRPYVETLVSADEEDVPLVSVLDGHSHALAF